MSFQWPWQRRQPAAPTAPDYLCNNEWVVMARQAHAADDIHAARMYYQKAAYGFRDMRDVECDQLRQEVADFVHDDPVYAAVLNSLSDALANQPGLLQSDLGKQMGDNRELFNYALYFAEVCGQLVRIKSGRSYKLYLPNQAPE